LTHAGELLHLLRLLGGRLRLLRLLLLLRRLLGRTGRRPLL
jgi:hypothetical protein